MLAFVVGIMFASPTCSFDNSCFGLTTLRIVRDKDWICREITEFKTIQHPLMCSPDNRFVPNVFVVHNVTNGNGNYRLDMTPTFSYDDYGILKYEFNLSTITCNPTFSAVVDVINHNVRTPLQVKVEIFMFLTLVAMFLSLCICSVRHPDTLSWSDFTTGYFIGSSSENSPTKAHFE